MSDVAIKVKNLSKRYRIGAREEIKTTFVDAITSALLSPIRNLRRLRELTQFNGKTGSDILWALEDVSFEVQRGEVLGIIGRNGAGKSTLLKVLSRITKPTNGTVELRGRVSSLLEVGTGFHPELTGRENIYLNGTILGMTRQEIDEKFDEIIEFAGVERFSDTPVKRFSSGMQVRLAFAVAAHLEPEILIVDEVLAVGDVEFQRKCIGKMQDVANSGRTVLFVSHNMSVIRDLCETGILLDKGKVKFSGSIDDTIKEYLALSNQPTLFGFQDLNEVKGRGSKMTPMLKSVRVVGAGADNDVIASNGSLDIIITVEPDTIIEEPAIGITVTSIMGNKIFSLGNHYSGIELETVDARRTYRIRIHELPLLPGSYQMNIGFGTKYQPLLDAVYNAITFDVVADDSLVGVYRLNPNTHGTVSIRNWDINEISESVSINESIS